MSLASAAGQGDREAIRKALYEGLSWFGTLPEPEGDVPERYHRWDDLGEFADRILAALTQPDTRAAPDARLRDAIEAAFREGHRVGYDCADNTSRSQLFHVEDAWADYRQALAAHDQSGAANANPDTERTE